MKRIGVDVGGTFTDLVLWDDDGTVVVHKTPSTNHDPSIGTMDGIAVLAERAGIDPQRRGETLEVVEFIAIANAARDLS